MPRLYHFFIFDTSGGTTLIRFKHGNSEVYICDPPMQPYSLATCPSAAAGLLLSSQPEIICAMRRFISGRSAGVRLFVCICGVMLSPMMLSKPTPQATAPAAKTPQQDGVASRDGRQVFASQCAGCHALDGKGGERAPDIATSVKTQQRSDEEIFRIIDKGVPGTGMPAFSSLSHEESKSLVAYVRSLQGRVAAVALPGDNVKGRSIFYGKAQCAQCHIVAGVGGYIAGDLTSYGANKPVEDIRAAIVKPSSVSRPGSGRAELTTRDGRKYSGLVRNEDIFSLQLQTLDGAFHLFDKSDLGNLQRVAAPLMPSDYGSTLSAGELNDLISFLMTAAREARTAQPKKVAHGDDEEYDDD